MDATEEAIEAMTRAANGLWQAIAKLKGVSPAELAEEAVGEWFAERVEEDLHGQGS